MIINVRVAWVGMQDFFWQNKFINLFIEALLLRCKRNRKFFINKLQKYLHIFFFINHYEEFIMHI